MDEHVTDRPLVAFVTTHWGDGDDEATTTTRLLAGAVARHARVEVLHLVAPEAAGPPRADSVFQVHPVPLLDARPLRSGVVQAALAGTVHATPAAGTLTKAATQAATQAATSAVLRGDEGHAPGLVDLLVRLRPHSVVLAGRHQPIEPAVLGRRGRPGAPRVVVLPFTASPAHLAGAPLARLLERADAVAHVHPGERAALRALGHERLAGLDLALPLNRGAVAHTLFGIRYFGRYVLLVRSFPPGGPRLRRSVTHEVLRHVLGDVSVAEVDGDRWRVSDGEGTLQLPVSPTRVNLWRLMAHAEATIDLRPPGPFGREALESMLLRTPVVVPEPSAAMAHAKAANGGLWYRDVGELVDATRAVLDPGIRARLAAQGAEYALRHHGQVDDFVARARSLVLGT